jgi:hypothetical protein
MPSATAASPGMRFNRPTISARYALQQACTFARREQRRPQISKLALGNFGLDPHQPSALVAELAVSLAPFEMLHVRAHRPDEIVAAGLDLRGDDPGHRRAVAVTASSPNRAESGCVLPRRSRLLPNCDEKSDRDHGNYGRNARIDIHVHVVMPPGGAARRSGDHPRRA